MPNKILVIGDLVIDETYYVEVNRISPEAPVPTAELLQAKPEKTPGGAGFAAAFAKAQGHDVYLCTAISKEYSSMLWSSYEIKVLEAERTRNNVTKTRFIDKDSEYHILRLDNDKIVQPPQISPTKVIDTIKGSHIDACLLADYKKGFFNPSFCWHELIDHLINQKIPILLDTRAENIRHFMIEDSLNPELWLKLNKSEAEKVRFNLLGKDILWEERNSRINKLIITRGSKGVKVYDNSIHYNIKVPENLKSYGTPDTTGCGDIFDVSFIEGLLYKTSATNAVKHAVMKASKYARIPFKDKLCSSSTKD